MAVHDQEHLAPGLSSQAPQELYHHVRSKGLGELSAGGQKQPAWAE
jgi:hypothetical protein